MARIFISYSRMDESFARRLAASLSNLGADVWIDVEDIPAGMKWSSAIQQGLDNAELMIVIISPDSMTSRNVEDEWQYYLDHGKPIIPVLLHPAQVHFQLSRIQYVDFHNQEYDTAVRRLHTELARKGVPLDPLQGDLDPLPPATPAHPPIQLPPAPAPTMKVPAARRQEPSPQYRQETSQPDSRRRYLIAGGGVLAVLIVVGVIVIAALNSADPEESNFPPEIPEAAAADNNEVDQSTPTPTTPPPTPTATQQAVITPGYQSPVTRNADWTPWEQTFNGARMVLVPPGCYTMGSTAQHIQEMFQECVAFLGSESSCNLFNDEGPQTQICFDQPFWIDRYQVNNGQYGSHGTFTGANEPRTNITWNQAQQHCQQRGARLPTEAEWEFAARGPDGLIYPWGNQFDGARLNFCDRNCEFNWRDANWNDGYAQVSPVGSYPAGASWVGALDMAGNTWEWTSTIYRNYPYAADDGRENLNDHNSRRTLRGGTWNFLRFETRTSARAANLENFPSSDWYGFRCVRDFNPADVIPVPASN
jgi:formylglycine-generating enzyme required for sulfatase activity